MEASKGKPQHSLKGYKSTFPHNYHHDNNNYNMASSHGIFKPSRIQRHTLKWRKDHFSRGNHRSRFPYRKSDVNNRKSNKTAEDVEEEERKKKLTDTANKLLNKIKTWNAEKNLSEGDSQQNCNTNQLVTENTCKQSEEKTNSEGKPKRIAHSKKAKLMKNRTPKSFSQPTKMITRYDVNKETVKDFQNRIQHKLIEEIMQMPKENLQNVLNDPKINPIMEVKMSRLVKENKLLIAQKLRALAESKMKSPGSSTNPQLLVDIDKLIDPVIETDLSVLPFELIKQMENVFQVQFDFSPKTDSQVESSVCDSAIDSTSVVEPEIQMETFIGNKHNVKVENNEDLSLYECSTDEDDEIDSNRSVGAYQEDIINETHEVTKIFKEAEINANWKNKKRKLSIVEQTKVTETELHISGSGEDSLSQDHESVLQEENHLPSNSGLVGCVLEEAVQNPSSLAVESKSMSCQTDGSSENASTQTPAECRSQSLYGVPLPKEATDDSISSLLEEVNSIQTLANKLNERRFMIFLQLAKMNPTGSFIGDDATEKNFMETVSNGNIHLVESLKQFFTNPGSYSNSNISESKRKLPERNTTNTRRQREDKKTNRNQ